jgi:hypothetical protein
MRGISRLLRADDTRPTRFHNSRGELCLGLVDACRAARSTLVRHIRHSLPELPWLTYPAIRHLDDCLSGRRLFEYGSGTSTKWYARRCSQVVSVENNRDWFQFTTAQTRALTNVEIILAETNEQSIDCIESVGGLFDAIVIDSLPIDATKGSVSASADLHRVQCLRKAIQYAAADCFFVVDNTDAYEQLSNEVAARFLPGEIVRLPGWVPGIFHPNETTIVHRKV